MLLAVLLAVLRCATGRDSGRSTGRATLCYWPCYWLLTCTTDFPTYCLLTHQALILGLYRGVLAGAQKLAAGEELC